MTDSKTREAFEAWVTNNGENPQVADKDHRGQYRLIHVSASWASWQRCWNSARRAALEEAERACKDVRDEGDSFKKHEDNHDDGHMDGCNNCAAAIRALADETQEG